MKIPKILSLFALLALGLWAAPLAKAQPGARVSFQTFYNELSPYGQWTSNPRYGSVWFPNVERDFQPYGTDGQWVMTEYGNTWVSDYNWGWAAFHYGRWFYDDYQGWGWVPDYQWGPAWVDWRSGGGYYGWAPLFPGVQFGTSFNIPLNYWVFVPQRYINRRRVFGYSVPRRSYGNIYNQTTIINNYYFNDNRTYAYGPRRDEIERVTRNDVPVYRADEIGRGGNYAGSRRNSDGSYTADGTSRNGLNRSPRDGSQNTNRSSRDYDSINNGTSGRTYDAGNSSRARSNSDYGNRSDNNANQNNSRTNDATEPSRRARSSSGYDNRSNDNTPSNNSRTYGADEPSRRARSNSYDNRSNDNTPSNNSRTYEADEPSSRARSNNDYQRSAPAQSFPQSSPNTDRTPSRSRESYEAPSQPSPSYERSSPRQSAPQSSPSNERSSPRQSAPQQSAPSVRSSSPPQSAPAPRSSTGSTTSPRSRGPR